jgi:hypothetical protein
MAIRGTANRPGSKAVARGDSAEPRAQPDSQRQAWQQARAKGSPVMKKLEATNDDGQMSIFFFEGTADQQLIGGQTAQARHSDDCL